MRPSLTGHVSNQLLLRLEEVEKNSIQSSFIDFARLNQLTWNWVDIKSVVSVSRAMGGVVEPHFISLNRHWLLVFSIILLELCWKNSIQSIFVNFARLN